MLSCIKKYLIRLWYTIYIQSYARHNIEDFSPVAINF